MLHGIYALYFKSRKNFADKSTWGKEKMPSDYTEKEVAKAARLAGCEGYAIWDFTTNKAISFKWFK